MLRWTDILLFFNCYVQQRNTLLPYFVLFLLFDSALPQYQQYTTRHLINNLTTCFYSVLFAETKITQPLTLQFRNTRF
jgi:hypothetical protein